MHKQRRCEEVVGGDGHSYRFAGTFGNIEAVSFVCGDPGALYTRLIDGELPPGDIRSVVLCCMEECDGVPVDSTTREQLADRFVESFGLQDCSLLARHLLGYGLIGDVKKKQIEQQSAIAGLLRTRNPSTLRASVVLGLLWAVTSGTSVLLACLIMKTG
jgi:hypothetical protein